MSIAANALFLICRYFNANCQFAGFARCLVRFYQVPAMTLSALQPANESELAAMIKTAFVDKCQLTITGGNTRAGLGRVCEISQSDGPGKRKNLSCAQLSGLVFYEPDELVLRARPGTALQEIEELLLSHQQHFGFEPICHARFYDPPPMAGQSSSPGLFAQGSLGGMIGVNAAGPRRILQGSARDHILGVRFVSGWGEAIFSGGRVVKNVTGYDLPKLLTGSYGTLGVLSEITIKTQPCPEDTCTILVPGLGDQQAIRLLIAATHSGQEGSGFAYLPVAVAQKLIKSGPDKDCALIRLEGDLASLDARMRAMVKDLGSLDSKTGYEILPSQASLQLWQDIRDGVVFQDLDRKASVWRISCPPAQGADLVAAIYAKSVPILRHYHDWAGGLIWLAVANQPVDGYAKAIRACCAKFGGYATLIRGNRKLRSNIAVFPPQPSVLAALNAQIKQAFDPKKILNPGRIRADL